MAIIDELKILVTAEVKKAIDDLDKVDRKTKKTASAADQLAKAFGVAKMGISVAAGVSALKKAVDIGAQLYTEFAQDELATVRLNAALANSEQITDGASKRFEQFAAELQKVSIYGDDATKTQVAYLASLGRTEPQIKKIITAAADLASATGVDLDTAVKQLNATLQGNAGILGRQNGAVRALTEEQLINGEAIDIIANQYDGFALKVGTSAAGAVSQLTNNIGDLRENLGSQFAEAFKPAIQALSDWISKINEANSVQKKLNEGLNSRGGLDALELALSDVNKRIDEQNKLAGDSRTRAYAQQALALLEKKKIEIESAIDIEKKNVAERKKTAETEAKITAERQRQSDIARIESDKNKEAQKMIDEAYASVARELRAAEARLDLTGEQIDFQKLSNVALEAYTKLLVDSNGLVTKNNVQVKDLRERIKEWSEALPVEQQEKIAELAENIAESAEANSKSWAVGVTMGEKIEQRYAEYLKSRAEDAAWDASKEASLVRQIELIEAMDDAMKEFAIASFEALGESLINGEDGLESFKDAAKDTFSALLRMIGLELAALAVKAAMTFDYVRAGLAAAGSAAALTASGAIKALAQGGIVTRPTTALIGEAGPEAVIPLRGDSAGILGGNTTVVVNQNIRGNVWTESDLQDLALDAVASASRGF